MTKQEFDAKYRSGTSSASRVGGFKILPEAVEREFVADLEALLDRARAEARREALKEAEAAGSSSAIHALSRWDGRTPFKPEYT